jgi:hypothetical protein
MAEIVLQQSPPGRWRVGRKWEGVLGKGLVGGRKVGVPERERGKRGEGGRDSEGWRVSVYV